MIQVILQLNMVILFILALFDQYPNQIAGVILEPATFYLHVKKLV